MANRTFRLEVCQLDLDLWQKLYYLHQKEYQRQRLWAIKYLYEGQSREEVTQLVNCSYKTLSNWIDKFISGGLSELLKPIKHQVKTRLSREQKQELKRMILEQKPIKYGIDRNIWTGEILSNVIKYRWNIELKSARIYEILAELNLSYQKAHRDYANADKEQQKQFVSTLKKTGVPRREGENSIF
ncbi:winged helix-turn-helix domain-containing protein [[Scytonema hofmanni] UTEX B 1581]|uniref:winged helix-turn-helix domain-containing protein n=1 Tax=[Scytonema hofmanni] UTEX B 1581 TaxID=379535 RepID=UPI000496E7D1|nr:winged helix-turn-helix domain-containing protein [[Scytonema hofmanni] UTEX B 1581]